MLPASPESFPTSAGRCLHGHAYEGARAGETSIVILGALAASHTYLRGFASWLASAGYGVLTFDYRGVGASEAAGDPSSNLDDWAEDARAALLHAQQRFAPKTLLVVGHSMGGMLLGHAGVEDEAQGALLIGAGLGRPRFYRGRGRLRIEAAYRALPRVARLCGGLPGWPFLLKQRVPRDVIVHWARWGRVGDFHRWNGESSARSFGRFRGPLCGVTVGDDSYAPIPAVYALLDHYHAAGVRRETLAPEGTRLGHFGLFRGAEASPARLALARWLDEVETAAKA